MKGLLIALLIWSFFGIAIYKVFPEDMTLVAFKMVSASSMLLVSFIAVEHFKSMWWTLLLMISLPTFFNRLILLLTEILPNSGINTTLLNAISTISVLVAFSLIKHKALWKY